MIHKEFLHKAALLTRLKSSAKFEAGFLEIQICSDTQDRNTVFAMVKQNTSYTKKIHEKSSW